MLACKALDERLDVPDCHVTIIVAGSTEEERYSRDAEHQLFGSVTNWRLKH